MRILLAIVIGAFIGGLIFDWPGAALGFMLGLVIGLIWYGRAREAKRALPPAVAARPAAAPVAPATEVQVLRLRLLALEERVAQLEAAAGIEVRVVPRGMAMPAPAEDAVAEPEPGAGAAARAAPVAATAGEPVTQSAREPVAVMAPMPEPVAAMASMAAPAEAGADADVAAPASATLPLRAEPTGPTLVQRLFSGNLVAKFGIIILFIGVSFFIKFALENAIVPVEVWFALAALGGAILLGIGWRLRESRTNYALILQGGGIGIMYLVIFGALKLYQLLPPTMAFALLVAIVALSAILAILQNALSLAAIGVTGGFLAPILVATGQGNHVALFSYYAILNAGIFLIAWFKAWRLLNLLGFVFTAGIGFLWGSRSYTPELFATTEPFVILFFVMYVGIAVLFAWRRAPDLKDYVDGTIVFGTPLIGFGLQAAVIRHIEYGMAFSALAMGLVYLLLARVLYGRRKDELRMLVESFFALALIFGTLAIPLALEARWTSAAWALEGAAVLWAGIRQQRLLMRAFGLLLQIGAGLAFVADSQLRFGAVETWPVLNSSGLGMLMIALAGLFSALQLHRAGDALRSEERDTSPLVFVWGALWWLALGVIEIDRHVSDPWQSTAGLLFLSGSAIAFSFASRRLDWPVARWPALLLWPFFLVLAAITLTHPFAAGGWFAWPIAFAVHYWMLKRHDDDPLPKFARGWFAFVHTATLLLLAFVGAREAHWWPAHSGLAHSAWTVAAIMVVPALLLWVITSAAISKRWPFARYPRPCVLWTGRVLTVVLVLWMWAANFTHDGASAPLPYLPIVNALDLGHLLAALAIAAWLLRTRDPALAPAVPGRPGIGIAIAGATAFVWLNAILLRTIHHWASIPYEFDAMADSLLVQAALSLFWTVLAFALMIFARVRAHRAAWMIGAALMTVVVIKLFLVDLSQLSGIERIVSFIGVGILMLLMGYFVPLPPKREAALVQEPSR